MNSEQNENNEQKGENSNNQEIINEILVKRSKQQRKSWFGQDKEKDKEYQKSNTLENTEAILEEESTEKPEKK